MIIQQIVVTRFVKNKDHMMSGWCNKPCSMKNVPPTPIIRKVGRAMPSVFLVRMVFIDWGR